MQIDRDSAERVIPKCTKFALRVFCGEELHPDVDKFIGSVAGIQCSSEVVLFIVFIWVLNFLFMVTWLHLCSSLGQFLLNIMDFHLYFIYAIAYFATCVHELDCVTCL